MDWTPIVVSIAATGAGLAVIAIVVAIILSLRRNRVLTTELRRIVDHNADVLEAAAAGLAEQMRQETAVASMPVLVQLDEPPLGIREQPWAAVRVRNVGNGSALNFVVWMRVAGHLYRSAGAETRGFSSVIHLAAGDTFEPGPLRNMLYVGKAHGPLDPGAAVVGDDPIANLVAYCGDTSGNRYRFNLRTADPSERWERGADAPAWAGAWDPRLSSSELARDEPHLAWTSLPERDLKQLIESLHEVLAALQDAVGPETDVSLTGRAGQRPRVTDPRSDFGAG
jgi:hypothetical protein